MTRNSFPGVSFKHQACEASNPSCPIFSYTYIFNPTTNKLAIFCFSVFQVLVQFHLRSWGGVVLTMKVQEYYYWEHKLTVWGKTCPHVIQKYETCTTTSSTFTGVLCGLLALALVVHYASFSCLLNVIILVQLICCLLSFHILIFHL